MQLHHLTGCAPEPLAYYLKALGILRVVGEQKDPEARGWWQDEHFCLLTKLSHTELEQFFLEEYAPTPMFNPWGARSGFYPGSSEKTARHALERIEAANLKRLGDFRDTIQKVRAVVEEGGGKKPESAEEESSMLDSLRRLVRGGGEAWLSAVVARVADDNKKPALVGTGGNEGSGSYVSAYLEAVVECIIDRSQDHALGLFCLSPTPKYSWNGSFGQFLPEGDASAWDFLFILEGAALFRSAIAVRSRTNQAGPQRFLASPFYFEPHGAGAGSSALIDEFSLQKGRPNPGRGEQWFPLWETPTRLSEVESMLSEGRCSVGSKRAVRPLDAARAIGRLGVVRGITSFRRYGYLQRNNLATHFAVPLARLDVRTRSHSRLAEDVAPWLQALKKSARDKGASARLVQAERRLADALFAVLSRDDSADRWQAVLLASAAVESIQADGAAVQAGPIPPLSPEWVVAANDGSVEWRLALALGSAAGSYDRWHRPDDPVRHHWLPLHPGAARFQEKDKRLMRVPRVVMTGRDAVGDCAALVGRRLVEAAQKGRRCLPLIAATGCEADPSDLASLIAGQVDLDRVSALARALMAIRWNQWQPAGPVHSQEIRHLDEAWMGLRLAFLPWPLDENRVIPANSAIVRRLVSGDCATAVDLTLRRLRGAGMRPPIQGAYADAPSARLWAAALAFPISKRTAHAMARNFEPQNQKEIR